MNVEKVVKAPQNPVTSRSLAIGDIPPTLAIAASTPIRKHPTTLTANVA